MPARTTPKSTRTQADSRAGAIAREQDKAIGAALAGGWVIVRAAEAIRAEGTDGMYSRGYIARKGRRAAYVKVFDYRRAVPDWKAARREAFTRAGYDFEKKVLELCAGRGLRGVNRLLASGVLRRAGSVERYLVLEAARCDLRGVLTRSVADGGDAALALGAVADVARALAGLHRAGMAHQDVKPSNVLILPRGRAVLGDMGRAAADFPAPHDRFGIVGDKACAPPEQLYGAFPEHWFVRAVACDAYLLGGLLCWAVCGRQASVLLHEEILAEHHWSNWKGTYAEILPKVRTALHRVIRRVAAGARRRLGASGADALGQVLAELCEPDPELRARPLGWRSRVRVIDVKPYAARIAALRA